MWCIWRGKQLIVPNQRTIYFFRLVLIKSCLSITAVLLQVYIFSLCIFNTYAYSRTVLRNGFAVTLPKGCESKMNRM